MAVITLPVLREGHGESGDIEKTGQPALQATA
jgi:two-component system nitrogen regulation sensor histidine kinase NtrY